MLVQADILYACVVVVYHVTSVMIGHWLMKKVWPMVIGYVLRTAGSFLYLKLCRFHLLG